MNDRDWDKRLHIKTIGREDEANANYSPYEPTPYAVLERIADLGLVKRKDHLLDYGCGKGRVALFMAGVVGCRATGIDHAQKLIDMAVENRRAARLGDRVAFTRCLAEQYAPRDENVLFFFNPFSEKVFEGVLRRILEARRENPRPTRILCYYPSEAYIALLDGAEALTRREDVDCGDLFNGNDPRERVVVYALEHAQEKGLK